MEKHKIILGEFLGELRGKKVDFVLKNFSESKRGVNRIVIGKMGAGKGYHLKNSSHGITHFEQTMKLKKTLS